MSEIIKTVDFGGKTLSFSMGHIAKQAHRLLLWLSLEIVRFCVPSVPPRKRGQVWTFLPLTADYLEKTFAAGKIPGGFYKREGRPRDHETL